MDFGKFHVDLSALAQVLLGLAALVTAWKGRQIAKEKADAKNTEEPRN